MILSKKPITKALIRLRGCAGWSAPVLFANPRRQVFSRRGPINNEPYFMLQLVQREQHSRQEFEKGAREDADRKWQTLKKVLEDEINILKEKLEVGLVYVQLLIYQVLHRLEKNLNIEGFLKKSLKN